MFGYEAGAKRAMLTKKQHELLLYIHDHLGAEGISPSFDEMKEALGLKSKSGIHRLITGLVERGFIRRLPHRARRRGAPPAGRPAGGHGRGRTWGRRPRGRLSPRSISDSACPV